MASAAVCRRRCFAALLALRIGSQLSSRTCRGVSTRGGTWDSHGFGFLVSALTGAACVANGLKVVLVARASVW